MSIFLLRLSVFLILFTSILWGVERLVTYELTTSNEVYFDNWNELKLLKKKPDVLIIGNSRAWIHYNTDILDSLLENETYNLGMDGMTSIQQEYRYKYYRQFNSKPKLIIFNVDDETYYNRKEILQPQQYFPYLDDSLISSQCIRMGLFPMRVYFPPVRYFEADICFEAMWRCLTNTPCDESVRKRKGFLGFDRPWNEATYKQIISKNLIAKFDPSLMKRHELFLQSLRNEGIELLLVFAPQFVDYTKHIAHHSTILLYYQNLAKRLGAGFWDYSQSDYSKSKDNFFEQHHMNLSASNRYSIEIGKRIKESQILN